MSDLKLSLESVEEIQARTPNFTCNGFYGEYFTLNIYTGMSSYAKLVYLLRSNWNVGRSLQSMLPIDRLFYYKHCLLPNPVSIHTSRPTQRHLFRLLLFITYSLIIIAVKYLYVS